MKHEFDDKYYVGRILTHCLNIEDFNKRFDGSYKTLLSDLAYLQAIVFSIVQIGENAKNLSSQFIIKYSGIPWSDLCKTRDKITHHYDGIDKELVWEIVSVNIPELKSYCEKILGEN